MERFDEQILLSDHFDVHQDRDTPIPGFFIVAARDDSKKSITDFNDVESIELMTVLRTVRNAMRKVLAIDTLYFFQNEDTEHGFHVWMFPRHKWMEEFGRKIQSVRPIMEYARSSMNTVSVRAEVKDCAQKMRLVLAKL